MAEIKIEDLYSKGGVPLQNQVQRNANDIASLKLDVRNTAGTPVLSTAWVQLRTSMWSGYVAADGQLLKRADYPDAWEAIEAGKVPKAVSDADWLANPNFRGCFTEGDGSTTFRVPDYNGKSEGSLGAAFLRGDGLNSLGSNGQIQGDAIRNIKGTSTSNGFSILGVISENDPKSPVYVSQGGSTRNYGTTGASADWGNAVGFDASRSVPTAADNHPVNVTGCWAIKLFGAVQNAGEIDAAALATQVAEAQSAIAELKSRKPKRVWKLIKDNTPWAVHTNIDFGIDMREKIILFEVLHKGSGSTTIAATNDGSASNYWVYGSWEYMFTWVNNTTLYFDSYNGQVSPIYRVWVEDYE